MFIHKKEIIRRYFLIIIVMVLCGIAIIVKAGIVMFGERKFWNDVQARFVKENMPVLPRRGNILSDNGQLMASSLPHYLIYMDFMTTVSDAKKNEEAQHYRDSVLYANIDEISQGMERILNDSEWSANRFKEHIKKGRKMRSRYYQLYPHRITYLQYKELKELPVFSLHSYSGGFVGEEYNSREKPFGSLAKRTLGDIYAAKDSAKNGLELKYDSILRGKTGIMHRQKVGNQYLGIIDKAPVDGNDIQTTLNVEMQDICEKSLTDMLESMDARSGICILMEVETGDIKAIVNMSKTGDGYQEIKNNAIADLLEPGSTFKTISMLIALDDKKVTLEDSVYGHNGIFNFYGTNMKDHNYNRGGYQMMKTPEVLMYSSNIGIAQIIDNNYKQDPDVFTNRLIEMGLGINYHLLAGEATPYIQHKKNNDKWSMITLPWMATGYNNQIPAINLVTFYNAIANGGKMLKPRLVKNVQKDGKIIEEYPVEVLRDRICKKKTIEDLTKILTMVVNDEKGLGKKAKSESFLVAGKTGTAQIYEGGGNTGRHLLSFCGFFPADAPKYSCIVQIQSNGGNYGGGGTAGVVFGEVARSVMAKNLTLPIEEAVDTLHVSHPSVKHGNLGEARYLLDKMDIDHLYEFENGNENQVWGKVFSTDSTLTLSPKKTVEGLVPNVIGMGAKDAVYLLSNAGLNVTLNGTGKVREQSIEPGVRAVKGKNIIINLK